MNHIRCWETFFFLNIRAYRILIKILLNVRRRSLVLAWEKKRFFFPPETFMPIMPHWIELYWNRLHVMLLILIEIERRAKLFFAERISGRNQRNQVTSIQNTEAMRVDAGRRVWKDGLGKFLWRCKHSSSDDKQQVQCLLLNVNQEDSSPGGQIDHAHHTGQQGPFEQPRVRLQFHYGANASKHGSGEQKLQKELEKYKRGLFLYECYLRGHRVCVSVCVRSFSPRVPCIGWRAADSASWSESSPAWLGRACGRAAGCAPGGPGRWACDPEEEERGTPWRQNVRRLQ